MSDINRAWQDWLKEMKKKHGKYLPPMWPTENILKWGDRAEKERKKYGLDDDEWVTLEAQKTEACLLYGRKPVNPLAIKCPKYYEVEFYGPGGLSRHHCYNGHPFDEDIYTCNVTGRYPCCEDGFILPDKLKITHRG